MNVLEPKMQVAAGVGGVWCFNTKCLTCEFDWLICQSCEVSIPNKKRLNQHSNQCHFTSLTLMESYDDSDDGAMMGGLMMMDEAECAVPSVNMV
jgi:hypothetical protein